MIGLIDAAHLVSLAEGLISAKKQQGPFTLDLTVRHVSVVESGGALDFGGSELREASTSALVPEKKAREEEFGWWNLGPGTYLVTFNETLTRAKPGVILIFPHKRLLAAAGWHPSVVLEKLDHEVRVPLQVGTHGLALKQNARVSRAIMLAEVSP
jgi:hypothetical protein